MGNSILDCPAQNHTSPTQTSVITTSSFAESLTVRQKGPPGERDGRYREKFPAASVFASVSTVSMPRKQTVTILPGSSHPQICTSLFCCKTMPSCKRRGILNFPIYYIPTVFLRTGTLESAKTIIPLTAVSSATTSGTATSAGANRVSPPSHPYTRRKNGWMR